MTDHSEIVIDFQLLLESMDNDPLLMRIACKTFLTTSEKSLKELSETVAKNDRVSTARIAHSIKSMVSTFGATDIKECCRELECRASTADKEWIDSQFTQLCMLVENMQLVVNHKLEE